jgi:hypothetical protein
MKEEEIELIMSILASKGGTSWYERDRTTEMTPVLEKRYREVAETVLEALDQHRNAGGGDDGEAAA